MFPQLYLLNFLLILSFHLLYFNLLRTFSSCLVITLSKHPALFYGYSILPNLFTDFNYRIVFWFCFVFSVFSYCVHCQLPAASLGQFVSFDVFLSCGDFSRTWSDPWLSVYSYVRGSRNWVCQLCLRSGLPWRGNNHWLIVLE